jgi:hypothetical protein
MFPAGLLMFEKEKIVNGLLSAFSERRSIAYADGPEITDTGQSVMRMGLAGEVVISIIPSHS